MYIFAAQLTIMRVTPKKRLGQHFLTDETIAEQIVRTLSPNEKNILEIGPGMGVLTKYLIQDQLLNIKVVEIDHESVEYLRHHFPQLGENLIEGDFLKSDLSCLFQSSFTVIGNFPYNISSQILFKVLENKDNVPTLIGMFQKEVAERIASKPGNKHYGILSVLLQAFYDIDYLFTVDETVFSPPPKVKSAVIRMQRNPEKKLHCDEFLFKNVVKTAFNQRRKTLRNSLRSIHFEKEFLNDPIFNLRPEQLSVSDFEKLVRNVQKIM